MTEPTALSKIIPVNLDFNSSSSLNWKPFNTGRAFWTKDIGTAFLEFSTELDLTGTVASIVLENQHDKSLVQKTISGITASPFYYQLGDEIQHDGRWFVQISVTKGEETIVSNSFAFMVNASIGHGKVARLVSIETFETLATQLTLLQTSINDYLTTAQESESIRVSTYEEVVLAEQERKDAEDTRKAISMADHSTAQSDHSTAQTDHTTATADHGIAVTDHTTAVADHAISQSDHSISLTDHTTATADHGIAVTDHTTAVADHASYEGLLTDGVLTTNIENTLQNLESTYAPDLLSVKQQLEHVETVSEIASQKADAMASGSPKGVYATLALLQAAYPTGTTGAYLVTADGKWYYWSGSAWTIGGSYLSTVGVATNFEMHKQTDGLLNLTKGTDFTWTDGLALLNTDGTTTNSRAVNAQNTGVSGFINVLGYSHVNCMNNRNYGFAVATVAFYDVSGVFISAYSTNTASSVFQSIPIPVGATQIKYCYYTDARADVLVLPRLSYIQLYNNVSLTVKQTDLQTDVSAIEGRYIGSSNLFDKTTLTANKELQLYAIADNVNKSYTDFIPVVTGESLYSAGHGSGAGAVVGYLYDSAKVKLSSRTFNFSSNFKNEITELGVAYVRVNANNSNVDTYIISKSIITKYEYFAQHDYKKISGHNNGAVNWWDGKVGDSLGDSLTGQGFFQTYVRRYLNLNAFVNHGIGGTKLSGPANVNGDSLWMDSRINSLNAAADFITVMGGANDGSVAIGELSLANYDTNTYAGALNVLISKIYYKYQKLSVGYYVGITYTGVTQVTTAKNVLIFLCTPFYMPVETDPNRTKVLANAVREIAKLWGLPVMDLAGKSMLNDGVKDVYWSTDRTHPLEIAHRDRIAPVMIGELEQFKPVDYTKAYYI